jgi:PleD family two-component response regulator
MTRDHGGLGLGLAIVKELAELHGGTVSATSAGRDRGATFTVRLRQAAIVDRSLRAPDRHHIAASASSNALAGVRILAVDDDPNTLEVLTEGLKAHGATVHAAESGFEAIAAWHREPFDLLICDLAMPQVDGFTVLEAI